MAIAEQIGRDYFAREIYLSWTAMSEEFGKNPKELARLEKVAEHKADLHFELAQEVMKIPPGDPISVAIALGEYIVKSGYASSAKYTKVSDNEIMSDLADVVVFPLISKLRGMGLVPAPMIAPEPSCRLFVSALKKLCNLKVEKMPVPENLKPPANIHRELWRISPLGKK